MEEEHLKELLVEFYKEKESDLWFLTGPITQDAYIEMLRVLGSKQHRRNKNRFTNIHFYTTTYGGNANAAYRISRLLQRCYENVCVGIFGPCKSAGTLITIGANEVIFGPFGEIGPLDIQIQKPDEMLFISGLDTLEGFDLVGDKLFVLFDRYLQGILAKGGALSFKAASELAKDLASEFVNPIAAQIDPYRLGEVERLMRIAREYAESLDRGNMKEHAIESLVNGYPSHDFIIDDREAKDLFKNVRPADTLESVIARNLSEFLLIPLRRPKIIDLATLLHDQEDHEKGGEQDGTSSQDQEQKPKARPKRRRRNKEGEDGTSSQDQEQKPKARPTRDS